MSVLLQISDTHFGTEQAPVVEALVDFAARERPDLVVLSGDITQRARRRQFREARTFVERLAAPHVAIPGNHDIPLFDLGTRLLRPYAPYRATFGDNLEPVHVSPELVVVCVNTTRWYRHTDGEVSARQVERVEERLANASARQLRIVVVHQPVAVMRAADEHDRLHGHAEALRRWSAAGADLVMGGHIHLPYVLPIAGLARPLWAVQAGTAVSSRVREGVPNSFNVLRWGVGYAADRCAIERWDYSVESKAFARVAVTEVAPDRRERR